MQVMQDSPVDDATKLTLAQDRRSDHPACQFAANDGPDRRVVLAAGLQVTVTPSDVLLDGLTVVGNHLGNHPTKDSP